MPQTNTNALILSYLLIKDLPRGQQVVLILGLIAGVVLIRPIEKYMTVYGIDQYRPTAYGFMIVAAGIAVLTGARILIGILFDVVYTSRRRNDVKQHAIGTQEIGN